jgi:hypothetical protein
MTCILTIDKMICFIFILQGEKKGLGRPGIMGRKVLSLLALPTKARILLKDDILACVRNLILVIEL